MWFDGALSLGSAALGGAVLTAVPPGRAARSRVRTPPSAISTDYCVKVGRFKARQLATRLGTCIATARGQGLTGHKAGNLHRYGEGTGP